VALVASLTGVSVAGFAVSGLANVPDTGLVARALPSDTMVYDRTGQVLLADLHPAGYQHYQTTLTGMGRYLPAATVAVEDANFWHEPGVDPISVGRAAWTDLRAGAPVQGGSTITQQLVKRRLVGSDASFSRKLREAVVAMRISSTYSKSQILAMYLNSISYGNAAYGAQAAARIYFHRDAAQLDLAQAALLAGLPQNPTFLNPLAHWEAARQRQHQVLAAMVRAHDITQEQADEAMAEDLSPPVHLFGPTVTNLAPGFVSYVRGQLTAEFGSDAADGGLTVVTSLDWGLQQLAQTSITDTVRANSGRDVSDGALVSLDPRTGQVLAMVGSAGPNVPGGHYNLAVGPPRNPGSSFKVFTYAAAIDSKRYTMVTPITDAPITIQPPGGQKYTPKNYDLRSHGVCQLQACLGNSLNVPAVEVELGTGVPSVVDEARKLGAPPFQDHGGGRYTTDDPNSSFGPSLTLGGYGETPLQMATGVSALAAGGVLHQPQAILNVTGPNGQRLGSGGSGDGSRVMDAGTAYIVSQMLSDDANRAMIFGRGTPLVLPGRTVAAKTGTTDRFGDGWTVGYTPSIATAVWMGNADNHPMVEGTDGIYVAAPAWHQFMAGALDRMGKGDEWYSMPSDVHPQYVGGRQTYFLDGTSPSTPAPQLPSWAHVGGSAGGSGPSGPGCRSWTYNGGSYWACTPGSSGLPGDPGGGGD
jgi:membrane peptidoglycan carboxypeptidase